jgi:hypothetical protein
MAASSPQDLKDDLNSLGLVVGPFAVITSSKAFALQYHQGNEGGEVQQIPDLEPSG